MALPRRPLPIPPIYTQERYDFYGNQDMPQNSYLYSSFIPSPFPYPSYPPDTPANDVGEPSALRGGTLLHKGFYDLLALIPSTPSPSRLFWRGPNPEPVAGPRYEDITSVGPPAANVAQADVKPTPPTSPPPVKNLKARRISKDMVSKPTGFV